MTKRELFEGIKILTGHFKRELSPTDEGSKTILRQIWEGTENEPAVALGKAVDEIVMEFSHLPAPKVIIDKVCRIGRDMRMAATREIEAQAEKERAENKRPVQDVFERKGIPPAARAAGMLVQGFRAGKIDRGGFLDGFRELDKIYPGSGWATEGGKLADFWSGKKEPEQIIFD